MCHNRRLFWLTATVHVFNWVCFLLSFFWVEMHRWILLFCVATLIYTIVIHRGIIRDGQFRERNGSRMGWGWRYTGWRKAVVIVAGCITVLMVLLSGHHGHSGLRGEIIDGAYWMVQGSIRIQQVTKEEYTALHCYESVRWYGKGLVFTANAFAYYAEIRDNEKIAALRRKLGKA